MYCVKCGVRLEGTEEKCPLCDTNTSIHYLKEESEQPLYPRGKYPPRQKGNGAWNGALLFLFVLPLLIAFFLDMQPDGRLLWFYYAAGATVLLYVVAALPLWFRAPNPVIFVPCDFAAATLFLLLINYMTGGSWFWTFALPLIGSMCLIVTAVICLMRYVGKGRFYIFGGGFIALGLTGLMMEFMTMLTFRVPFVGWSAYPLVVLGLLGGLLIFLGINKNVREKMERRFFL